MSSISSNISQGGRGRGRGRGSRHSQPQSRGRSNGVPSYQEDILLNIIEDVLPLGSLMWQSVANRYHVLSKEPNLRDFNDVKRKFGELHKFGKAQPTGTKTVKESQARALRIYRLMLQKESCANIGVDTDGFGGGGGGDEVEEEFIDDDYNGGEEDDAAEDNNNLNDSFDSSYQHDDDAEHFNLDDAVEYEAGVDQDGAPLPKRLKKTSPSAVSSSSSMTNTVVSSVKTKNSRPSGGQKPSSGRGTAASAMHAMVEVMRDSNLHRQQQDLNRQQMDIMKFAIEQQKASASENTALRAQVAAMQTQMQQIMGMLQQQQHKQSSSSRTDPEATQMMDA